MDKYNINIFINSVKEDRLQDVLKIFIGRSSSQKIDNPQITVIQKPNYNTDFDHDYNFVQNSIDQANIDDSNSNRDSYSIFTQDSIVSTCRVQELYDAIEDVIESSPDFDIFYLSNYMDQCDKMTDIKSMTDSNKKIVTTVSPSPGSFSCILFSPSGKKKFNEYFKTNPVPKSTLSSKKTLGNYLNLKTTSGDFKSITIVPPLIQFNIFDRKNDRELNKVMLCSESESIKKKREITKNVTKPDVKKETPGEYNLSFIWFIIIVIAILIIAFVLIKYTSTKNSVTPAYSSATSGSIDPRVN